MRYVVEPDVTVLDEGRVLLGGSPLSFQRLTAAGATQFESLSAAGTHQRGPLVERLVDRGLVSVELDDDDGMAPHDLTVVIPVRNRVRSLADALARLDATVLGMQVVVVDDGSDDAAAHRRVAEAAGARVVRIDRSGGPAAARNAGLQAVATPFVAFVDSDIEIAASELCRLAGHLEDPAVALVAPRIGHAIVHGPTRARPSALDRYEASGSSLDLGPRAGVVRARSRVSYVPAAALVARCADFRSVGGFDESMTVAEDVDLCWRLDEIGRRCWYDPHVIAEHGRGDRLVGFLARRRDYGTGAAALATRHPGSVPPVSVSGWSVAVWGLIALRRRWSVAAAAVVAAGTAEAMVAKLGFLDRPRPVAWRLVGRGHLGAGRLLGHAVVRPYWPMAALVAVRFRRARPVVAAAAVVPALIDWRERRPSLDPLRWTALRLLDHLAYSWGVWSGSMKARSPGALVPDLRSGRLRSDGNVTGRG